MHYLWLLAAIVSEVIATSALSAANGFHRLGPLLVLVSIELVSDISFPADTSFPEIWRAHYGREFLKSVESVPYARRIVSVF